jgi:outer membrane protein assembly factor BamB
MIFRAAVLLTFLIGTVTPVTADDWPTWRGIHRDGVWRESGIVKAYDELRPEWTAEVASGYSGPSVADGRVYVSDRITKPAQTERIHCFDEETGKSLWSYEYNCEYRNVSYTAGPRASVQIHEGVAYSLGTMGNLIALDAKSGRLLWSRDLNTDYQIEMPVWGIAAAPLITEDLIVVHIGGTPDATVVAFGLMDGKERWRALDDRASYSAPILIEQAGKQVIVAWTGDSIAGLDPMTGRVHWKQPFPPTRMVIGIATPIVRDNQLFVSSFYDGAMMVNLHPTELEASLAWASAGADEKNTESLHSLISTPIWIGDHIYGIDSYGELRCIKALDGSRVWTDTTAVRRARWSTAHFVRHQDNVWIFNEEGELLLTELSPDGMNVLSRASLIAPTRDQLNQRGGVAWSHPAFANGHIFIRSDTQLLSVDLREK